MNKKKIILLILITLIAAIVSYFLSYLLVSIFKNEFKIIFTKELLLDKAVLIVAAGLFGICIIGITK